MIPEGYERLSFDDHVLVARVNLCCAAVALMVFAFLVTEWDWPVQALAAFASAGLVLLARQLDTLFRRFDPLDDTDDADEPSVHMIEHYLPPF
jgi:hypothetical protein